jgi:hypothetical protein
MITVGAIVMFTNSAGRTFDATVTRVEGAWVTIVETMGSCYKVPRGQLKVRSKVNSDVV